MLFIFSFADAFAGQEGCSEFILLVICCRGPVCISWEAVPLSGSVLLDCFHGQEIEAGIQPDKVYTLCFWSASRFLDLMGAAYLHRS